MGATRTKLTAAGFNPEQPFQSRPNLSVAEKGKKYSVKFEPPADCGVYAIDGDVIKQGCRCDKLVVTEPRLGKDGGIEIFVELKGKNVSHAIEQLETTLQHPLFRNKPAGVCRAARIVAQHYPHNTGNSVLERAKRRFLKSYQCDLRTCHSGVAETL